MKRICLTIARIKQDLTQKEVSELIGVSQQIYSRYEKGTATPSSFTLINKLEEVLKVDKKCLFQDIYQEECKCNGNCVSNSR